MLRSASSSLSPGLRRRADRIWDKGERVLSKSNLSVSRGAATDMACMPRETRDRVELCLVTPRSTLFDDPPELEIDATGGRQRQKRASTFWSTELPVQVVLLLALPLRPLVRPDSGQHTSLRNRIHTQTCTDSTSISDSTSG